MYKQTYKPRLPRCLLHAPSPTPFKEVLQADRGPHRWSVDRKARQEAEAEEGKQNYEPWSDTVHGFYILLKDQVRHL